ncbi:TPA: bacteriocin [Escherichia coli]|nr:bacteriocin [Escherichia coli]
MDYFPENQKSMMYRNGRKAIFLPMRLSDIMGNDKLLDELRVRASC